MRFIVMVKATRTSESGAMPDEKLIAEMGAFNDELIKAGVLLDATGLQPSSKGARVQFSPGNRRTVVDGPFPETKELIAGYWLWKVKSKDEALKWLTRCPHPFPGQEAQIEIRPLMDEGDCAASEAGSKVSQAPNRGA